MKHTPLFISDPPQETNTRGAEAPLMLKVIVSKATSVTFMGDLWRPAMQRDSRHLWMPPTIDGGHLTLLAPRPWTLNVAMGEAAILP